MTDVVTDIIYLALGMAFGALLFNFGRLFAMHEYMGIQKPFIMELHNFFEFLESKMKEDKK